MPYLNTLKQRWKKLLLKNYAFHSTVHNIRLYLVIAFEDLESCNKVSNGSSG